LLHPLLVEGERVTKQHSQGSSNALLHRTRGAARDGPIFEERGIAKMGTELAVIGKTLKYLTDLGNKPIKAQLLRYSTSLNMKKADA
jgi:hypothetical protein